MNEKEFVKILKKKIKKIPYKERTDILNEYKVHFINGQENGQTEQEICDELGDPKIIGKDICAVNALGNVKDEKNFKNLLSAFIAISSLSILNFIFVCITLFTILLLSPLILSLLIITPVLLLLPLILIAVGFIYGFDFIGFSDIIKSIIGVLIGILLSLLIYHTAKNLYNLFIQYLNWNLNIVKKN